MTVLLGLAWLGWPASHLLCAHKSHDIAVATRVRRHQTSAIRVFGSSAVSVIQYQWTIYIASVRPLPESGTPGVEWTLLRRRWPSAPSLLAPHRSAVVRSVASRLSPTSLSDLSESSHRAGLRSREFSSVLHCCPATIPPATSSTEPGLVISATIFGCSALLSVVRFG
ncbi:hypothetical protein BS78_02G312500 [Paspalum vaginatum]|nr:hypothetical protein BS78_02G312500 [Paspalum vaginatum]